MLIEQLVAEGRRTKLGKSPTKKGLQSAIASVGNSYYWHLIQKYGKDQWLISYKAGGAPLLESAFKFLGGTGQPFAVIYKVSDSDYVVSIWRSVADVTEMRLTGELSQTHYGLIQAGIGKEGVLLIVDHCLLVPETFHDLFTVTVVRAEQLFEQKLWLQEKPKLPTPLSHWIAGGVALSIGVAIIALVALKEQDRVEKKAVVDEFKAFRESLINRGAAKAMAVQLYRDIAFTQMVPGWKAEGIIVKGESVSIEFVKDGAASFNDIIDMATKTGRTVASLGQEKIVISSQHTPVPTLSEAIVLPLEDLQAYLLRPFDEWAPAPETLISFGKETERNGYNEIPLDITVDRYYGDDIDTLGTLLNGLPITFERANFRLNESGELSGKVSFIMRGCLLSRINSGKCKVRE